MPFMVTRLTISGNLQEVNRFRSVLWILFEILLIFDLQKFPLLFVYVLEKTRYFNIYNFLLRGFLLINIQ